MKVPLVTFALTLFIVGGCGGGNGDSSGDAGGGAEGDAKIFEADDYSFAYPGDWEERNPKARAEGGESISSTSVGLSDMDVWAVNVYSHPVSITEGNIDDYTDEITESIQGLFQELDGSLSAGPTRVTVDGLPSLRWEGSLVNADGVRVQSRFTSVFDTSTEYFLNCQFTREHAEEMKRGCDQVEESFQVE